MRRAHRVGLHLLTLLLVTVAAQWVSRAVAAQQSDYFDGDEYFHQDKLSKPTHDVRVEYNVRIPMRDGVTLSADIYYPVGDGPFPAVLRRTPYSNNNAQRVEGSLWFAKRGYVVVNQDVRGRYDSGGEFYHYRNEANDGYDTDEWIGHQPWSNGKIGTYGGSYTGYTQLTQAIRGSQYLTAVGAEVTTSNIYNNWAYVDGAFLYGFTLPWGAVFTDGHVNQVSSAVDWPSAFRHLPVATSDAAAGRVSASYRDWARHPRRDDPYWDGMSFENEIKNVKVPILSIEGWYDMFLRGALADHNRIVSNSPSELARENKRLIIGPWRHAARGRNNSPGSPTTGPNRSLDFGPAAEADMQVVYLRWFDHWLKGIDNGVGEQPPVRLFVMGKNYWRYEHEWPLARTQYTSYYLGSNGQANSVSGNGTLSTDAPEGKGTDHFVYDPANPVPTGGGNLCCSSVPIGPWNQQKIEARDDVLVYTTPVLTRPVEVTGPIKMKLYASSSAVDTDWTAKLVDVYPEGFAVNIQDGIIRARYRNGTHAPAELLDPGKVYEYTIDMWATSNVFLPGHRIRVEISSSNFPRFDRNLNTAENPETGTRMEVAKQTIYHSRRYPSHIVLPIIPITDGVGVTAAQ